MKLRITTPLTIVVEDDQVNSLRAEDASGSFGIFAGHADFLTSLAISVVSWTNGVPGSERSESANRNYCAVRRGVFSVSNGQTIAIATREAVVGTDLATLDEEVLTRFRTDLDAERVEHVVSAQLQLNAIRQLMRHLRSRAPMGYGPSAQAGRSGRSA
ncbi:F0F1 ATP synthase subunit epsilon [Variovorax sp. LG9.2]|jgi:F-type H+-transporting ATPase subunit epsilon|uniref:F0F1 ATP synthase subunit epsilon n=1 Tax=Variovorax sp. LG9.2 TaxID=3048626 RepID=UPI002B22229F|nr:F0F1 ATP synthase subunit epsilon [Variovorax sp. LG9.2]MEB0055849.1 F0F1 ATP synthase subunit epsilon [Variovorax sp. LG9.2]